MGLQTLMQSHTLDDDSNQHMQQSFVGNETHMTTGKIIILLFLYVTAHLNIYLYICMYIC